MQKDIKTTNWQLLTKDFGNYEYHVNEKKYWPYKDRKSFNKMLDEYFGERPLDQLIFLLA